MNIQAQIYRTLLAGDEAGLAAALREGGLEITESADDGIWLDASRATVKFRRGGWLIGDCPIGDAALTDELCELVGMWMAVERQSREKIETFCNLYPHDWEVTQYGGDWLNVCDTATRYWVLVDDVCKLDLSDESVEVFRQPGGYAILCDQLPAYHCSDVPEDVLRLADEESEHIRHSWGW